MGPLSRPLRPRKGVLTADASLARRSQCNIYVYHIAVVDPPQSPAFLLLGKHTVNGSIWCCAYGGRLLVYGLENGGGDMILHVCYVGPKHADVPGPHISMNIGPWSVRSPHKEDDLSVIHD